MISNSAISDARFEAALTAVEGAKDIDDLRAALLGLLHPYGLKHAVYHALKIPSANIEQKVISFTYPKDWVDHYLSKRYFDIDPVVRLGRSSLLPVDWEDLDRSSHPVRRLFREAEEAGVGRRGLTIPIRGPIGDHAILTLTSEMPEQDWRALRRGYIRDMQIIAHYVHARVLALHQTIPATPTLTLSGRERETLQWAAVGKTIEETAIILHLSQSTVRVYLDSARHKLDCLTKPQAVAKALRFGLISF